MAETQFGMVKVWDPADYPVDRKGQEGVCKFAPRCGGSEEYGRRPDHPTCPDAPAEFSERIGGGHLGGFDRYMPLCRTRAERRFGSVALAQAEAEAGATA